MYKLKEFYQYKRELKNRNKVFRNVLRVKPRKSCQNFFGTKVVTDFSRGILYMKSSRSNTIVSLVDLKGKVQVIKSCGCFGFQGKKKRTTKFAVETTLSSVLQKAKDLGWTRLDIYLNGFAKGRFYVLNGIKKSNLRMGFLRDITPIPHNGCRLKKLRRG